MALAHWEPETGKGPALLTDDLWPADLTTRLLLKEQGQGGVSVKPPPAGLAGSMAPKGGGLNNHCQVKPNVTIQHSEGTGMTQTNTPNV